MAISSIPSATTNKDDSGRYSWEKTVTDVNNVDEMFRNARDLGYLRLNYSRLNAIGGLAKFDSQDLFKVQVQSAGKLSLNLRAADSAEDEKVLDLSKYDEALREAMRESDPEGYAEMLEQERLAEEQKQLLSYTAPGMRFQVYAKKGGKEVLVADSHATEGSKLNDAAKQMLTGEYKAAKGDYYVKITRDDTVDDDEEIAYAMQMQVGSKYTHDYIMTEQVSDDTKNKRITNTPASLYGGTLSVSNVLQIQAGRYQAAADMLATGYLNMADIYNKNSKF